MSESVSESVFKSWVLKKVVKQRGANKGLEGKVIWAKKDPADPGEDLIGVCYHFGGRVYACRPHNFAFAPKEVYYTPKPASIQKAKELMAEEHRAVVLQNRTFVPFLQTSINVAVVRHLMKVNILRKAGRLGTVLKEHGSSWNAYYEERQSRDAACLDPGVVTYEVLKRLDEPW